MQMQAYEDVAHVIQVAVAPVFLLSGIGVMLSVCISRLGRIVDRARFLEGCFSDVGAGERPSALREGDVAAGEQPSNLRELDVLTRRARSIRLAIVLCTISGLLICLLISSLFLDYLQALNMSLPIALLFLGAMACLVGAFGSFLHEITMATAPFGRRPTREP